MTEEKQRKSFKVIKEKKHIQIDGVDYYTYKYARANEIEVNRKETWTINGITYLIADGQGVPETA